MVMATVLALVAGGFLIATLPIDSTIASTVKQICAMWTRYFQLSSNERIRDIFVVCLIVAAKLLG